MRLLGCWIFAALEYVVKKTNLPNAFLTVEVLRYEIEGCRKHVNIRYLLGILSEAEPSEVYA